MTGNRTILKDKMFKAGPKGKVVFESCLGCFRFQMRVGDAPSSIVISAIANPPGNVL